jgi:hypothetical protein
MLERVFDVGKGRLFIDELGELEFRKHRLQFVFGFAGDALD